MIRLGWGVGVNFVDGVLVRIRMHDTLGTVLPLRNPKPVPLSAFRYLSARQVEIFTSTTPTVDMSGTSIFAAGVPRIDLVPSHHGIMICYMHLPLPVGLERKFVKTYLITGNSHPARVIKRSSIIAHGIISQFLLSHMGTSILY